MAKVKAVPSKRVGRGGSVLQARSSPRNIMHSKFQFVPQGTRLAMKSIVGVVICFYTCFAEPVVLVSKLGPNAALKSQVDLAARFYGLNVRAVNMNDQPDVRLVMDALRQPDAVAAVVAANVLGHLDRSKVFAALRRPSGRSVPLLIVDLGTEDDAAAVAGWSGGLVTNCCRTHGSEQWKLRIGKTEIASQLADVVLPFNGAFACGFKVAAKFTGRVLAEASSQGSTFPAFVDFDRNGQHIFALAGLSPAGSSTTPGESNLIAAFSNIAPVMMFLHFAAGDRAWHPMDQYANLTVDDPWLIESYGNLNYQALLAEMEKHDFHTTIGFIPWNFDRSRPGVVSLFRGNPKRFSVAIHGNNHNHREFGDYKSEPLAGQTVNIGQALARMEEFRRRTGIRYDPVMVFPHAVAPEETLRVLKADNYWATVNSENVPLGSSGPDDPLFLLRPETLAFSNFLSLKRYSAEVPVSATTLAINAYLGNPLLFYVHEQFFYKNAGAFDGLADYVNRIAPRTQWRSLGDIVRHLYLLRLIGGDYDVMAFSPRFSLINPEDRNMVFHVQKQDNFLPPIHSLTVEGEAVSYRRFRDGIAFDVSLPPKQTREVEISYVSEPNIGQTDVAKRSVVANMLRRLSDFRDITLSRSDAGRKLIAIYSRPRLDMSMSNIERPVLLILASGILCVFGRALYHRTKGHPRPRATTNGKMAT